MNSTLINAAVSKYFKKNIPALRSGDVVRVHEKVKEGSKERIQVFEGIVLRVRGGQGMDGTFTVRRISSGIGVEKTFPLHLPAIIKIEKIRHLNLRQARLYYLRDLTEKQIKRKARGELTEFIAWEEPDAAEEEEKLKAEQAAKAQAREKAEAQKEAEIQAKIAKVKAQHKDLEGDIEKEQKSNQNEAA